MPAHIDLHRSHFDETERPLVEMGAIAISTFRYACGIEALRIRNARGAVSYTHLTLPTILLV